MSDCGKNNYSDRYTILSDDDSRLTGKRSKTQKQRTITKEQQQRSAYSIIDSYQVL